MATDSISIAPTRARGWHGRPRARSLARLWTYPELLGVMAVAAVLGVWNLSINGMANTYYAAAVKSMAASWHNFLFASMDPSGLMTVDKPPLALWVQALSVRVFGFSSWSMLVPQVLMGVAAAGLLYDLTRRLFGRAAGFVAGVALATTPVIVAISRHNNPDELLVLCCVAALWCALRAFESGRTKWLVWTGVAVGLGFETKMAVALMVVPGIALGWLWTRWTPRGQGAAAKANLRAFSQLLWGGLAMVAVGCAWPVLVTLTPAADRPWISGTTDNSIWSLIFNYNGIGRLAGQTGGPSVAAAGGFAGGGAGQNSLFGGSTGVTRLFNDALGNQAGWLLGMALVSGLGILVLTRLRRRDPRTGWLFAAGGAFLTTCVAFSFASGIFHPYYVSLVAPFAAALVGAGVGQMLPRPFGVAADDRTMRWLAPLAIGAGIISELVVLGTISGLSWAYPLVIAVAGAGAILLTSTLPTRVRAALVAAAVVALLAAPATWAVETLGHATSGTFPAGGPSGAESGGGPGGGFGGPRGGVPGGAPGGGGFGGDSTSLQQAIAYAKAHGGGTIGVESQSSAAAVILSSNAEVAGLGGFSGKESSVTAQWLAMEVRDGRLRWVIPDNTSGGGLPGDTRTGSEQAFAIAEKACTRVTVNASTTIYDCQGRSAAISAAASSSAS